MLTGVAHPNQTTGGVKNMRTLQPPSSSGNIQQAKIANAQNMVYKGGKGRLSNKMPPSGQKIGQNRTSTSTMDTGQQNNIYMNGRAGNNLIGQQQQARASTSLEKQAP